MATVGFSALGAITRRTPDQLKNLGRLDIQPWDESEFPEGKRRRYTASHAIRLILVEALTEQGVTIGGAAQAVNFHGSAIEQFLDAVETREVPQPRFVGYLRTYIERSHGLESRWEPRTVSLSTATEIASAIGGALASVGTVVNYNSGIRERAVNGPHLAVASIGESYRRLEELAKDAGYSIVGRSIFRAVPVDTEGDDE